MTMKITLLFVCLGLMVVLMVDQINALPARNQASRRNIQNQLPRGGRKVSNSLRRGRQEEEAPPAPAEGAADAASDVPEWCDPTKPMGAWLNFQKIRVWCSDKGHTNFGPYGGVPSADAEADAPPAGEAPAA